MKKALILGGGIAGLSAAAFLTGSGFIVEVIEASPKLGGRAYSFKDKETGMLIDNGQHILMGCYTETLDFFNLIKAGDNLLYQKDLNVNFLREEFTVFTLKASDLFYPLNLLTAILNYKALTLKERFRVLFFFIKLLIKSGKDLKDLSVLEWVISQKQSENSRKAFWDFIAVGALNTSTGKASAKMFSDILKRIFFGGKKAALILLPKEGLSETYCDNAAEFIKAGGGNIRLSTQVLEIKIENNNAAEILTSAGNITEFDFIISALPLYAAEKILPAGVIYPKPLMKYSSIISFHLKIKRNFLKEKFYGLIGSPVHWIFNHDDHLSLVISDADYLIGKSSEELFDLALCELKKFTGLPADEVISYKIIKEKRATFIPSNDILDNRPSTRTSIKNFFLAGDWISTGLPSTIESAVLSGKLAAEAVKSSLQS